MTEQQIAAMRQALEALKDAQNGMAECSEELGFDFANEQHGVEQAITALTAALEQPAIPQRHYVPEGWKLVPVEPTISMCIAGDEARMNVDDATRTPAIYRAMLNAAPTPQGE